MKKIGILMMFLMLVFITQADLVDDFEDYTLGDPQAPWTTSESAVYAAIESDGSTQYITSWGSSDYRDYKRPLAPVAAVDDTGLATYYVRIMATDATNIDFASGLSENDAMTWYSDYGPYFRLIVSSGPADTVELSVRNGGAFVDDLAYLNVNQWYNFWMVVDCANQTHDLYYAADGDAPTLARAANGFRLAYANPLDTVVLMTAGSSTSGNARVDDIYILDGADTTVPSAPLKNVSPLNNATLIPVARTAAENDLVFTVIDPNIADVEVYLSANDPNVPDLIKTINSVGTGQQTVTLETELGADLSFETIYYWQVIGYEPNTLIPANGNDVAVPGPVWNFTTAPEAPVITVDPPAYTAVDAGEPNIVLSVTGINGDFQWYKDGSPIADAAGVYAGTTTDTLTIYDVQLADEGYYTCVISSLVGDDTSAPARVMIHRQTSYYDFEGTSVVDGNNVFVDSIDGYPAVLMQESASAGLPTSVTDANSIAGLGAYLYLANEDHATDPNGQYLQIYPGVVDYADITITVWAQATYSQAYQRIVDFGRVDDLSSYMFLSMDVGGYDPRFTMRRYSGDQNIQLDLDVSNWIGAGTGWHFLAATIGGNTGKFYIDGEWVGTNSNMWGDPINVAAVLNYIGKSQYTADPEFSGYIDDLKIYNYARTNEQIAQDYMAVTGNASVCNAENEDLGDYDANDDCKLDLSDFASFAARWLEDDNFYQAP